MLQFFLTKKESFFVFIVTLVYSGYIPFPYKMHCIHLSHLFPASSDFFLSHIFSYAQLVSFCITLKLCFLFYNALSTNVTAVSDKEGFFFYIVTLVYSRYIAVSYIMHCIHLSHLFAASSEICVLYILLCIARLSLFYNEALLSPLKYIVYKYYSSFRQRRGLFFHRDTCIHWLHSFSLYNALYTLVTLFWCFIRKYLFHIFS